MIARVTAQHRNSYVLRADDGTETSAVLGGKFRYETMRREDLPAVGDFVRIRESVIEEVLPRRTVFLRKAVGSVSEAQVIAANIDTVFIVSGLDDDFNPRRLERYYLTARSSKAQCVILLNKADLCDDPDARVLEVRALAPGADVVPISALRGNGIDALRPYLIPGETVAFVGSSGAGKSTLMNRLLGRDQQSTGPVREADSRGRHTTTHRELFETPSGVLLIDTPGIRELQPWTGGEDVVDAFSDIEALAPQCRYRNCSHQQGDEGCAVQSSIDPARLLSYHKVRKEAAHLVRQLDLRARLDQKAKWKKIHKAMRNVDKRA